MHVRTHFGDHQEFAEPKDRITRLTRTKTYGMHLVGAIVLL